MSQAKFPVTLAIRALRGTSPFGLRRAMPVFMQQSILEAPTIYINGGARGFLVAIDPREAQRVLSPTLVDIAVEK